MKVTIKDIAKLCNVSVTTVSRVINDKTNNIGANTVVRVKEAISRTGYKPNSIARSMVTGKSHIIGLVVPDVSNPFFSELSKGIEDYMNDLEYGVLLCNTDSSFEKEERYIDLLRCKVVDGIIFTTQNNYESPKYFIDMLQKRYPTVLIERYIEGAEGVPGVYVDNLGGAEKICNFIVEKGHKVIACITGSMNTTNTILRLQGYKNALAMACIGIDENLIIEGNYHYDSGYECMNELLRRHGRKLDAVFVCNDLMAYGAYKALQEAGINVPDDMSIAGFDNTTFLDVFEPRITTVHLPVHKIGVKAAEMLMAIINNEKLECIKYDFKLGIVDKGSVGTKVK